MSPKDADRKANSVDPDQTAPAPGGAVLVYIVCLDLSVRKVRIITVVLYHWHLKFGP